MHMFCKWSLNMPSSTGRLQMQISSMGLEIARSRSPDRPEARRRCMWRRRTATAPWQSGSWRPAPRSTLTTKLAAASELISALGRGRWAKAQRKETLETRGFEVDKISSTLGTKWDIFCNAQCRQSKQHISSKQQRVQIFISG